MTTETTALALAANIAEPQAATRAPAAPADVARFTRMVESAPVQDSYAQPPLEPPVPPDLAAQLIKTGNEVSEHYHRVRHEDLQSLIDNFDITDPKNLIKVLEFQVEMLTTSIEFQLANGLADTGKHFATTLFRTQN